MALDQFSAEVQIDEISLWTGYSQSQYKKEVDVELTGVVLKDHLHGLISPFEKKKSFAKVMINFNDQHNIYDPDIKSINYIGVIRSSENSDEGIRAEVLLNIRDEHVSFFQSVGKQLITINPILYRETEHESPFIKEDKYQKFRFIQRCQFLVHPNVVET